MNRPRAGVGTIVTLALAGTLAIPRGAGAEGSAELISYAEGGGVAVGATEGFGTADDPLAGVVVGSDGGPVAHGLKLHNCRAAFLAGRAG